MLLINSSLFYFNSIVLVMLLTWIWQTSHYNLTKKGSLLFQVETVEGFMDLRIPSGTQPGENLKVSQLGVPDIRRPNVRGDHYFMIKVKIPKNIRFELPELSNSMCKKYFVYILQPNKFDFFSSFSYLQNCLLNITSGSY